MNSTYRVPAHQLEAIKREYRADQIDAREADIARALLRVEATYDVRVALRAAAELSERGVSASCVERNYPAGLSTHDYIADIVWAAKAA